MIRVRCGCRVDLAGGTLDIWPLGLLHPGARTINFAIDLPVEVTVEARERGFAIVQDGVESTAARAAELAARAETALVGCVVATVGAAPCRIRLASASPRGAALGASSSVAVALLAALELFRDGALTASPLERARLARDLEARLMSLPTGIQDHLPPQIGGALSIEHAPGGEHVERLDVDLGGLAARLLIAYSGESHFSAGNNWEVIRRRLDGDHEVIAALDTIRDVAVAIERPLVRGDWAAVGQLLAEEWRARRRLSPATSTPKLEELLDVASALGAWGGKACGAGGGGSCAVLAPPERRAAIAEAWRRAGATILEAAPTPCGLVCDEI